MTLSFFNRSKLLRLARGPQKRLSARFFLSLIILCLSCSRFFAAPSFTSSSMASVNEGVSAGTQVYTAVATESGFTLSYSLSGPDAAAFAIDSSTGAVTIKSVPNFETRSYYNFNVVASDGTTNSTLGVTLNVNNLPPVITSSSNASINEGANAGTTVYNTIAADPGGGSVTFALTGQDAAAFTINSSTGVVTINNVPDYETKSSYNFSVKASDAYGAFTTVGVTLSVNDLPPVITAPPIDYINNSASAGTTVCTATAADPGGGAVTYSLTGPDASTFTINSSTGVVTINNAPNYQIQSSYNFNVKASDPNGAFNTLNVTIYVTAITSPSNVGIVEGANAGTTVYTAIEANPSGGTVTWSLNGLDAPAFTISSSTGIVTINNVPNYETKSSYNFNLIASDGVGGVNSKAVTINVTNLPPVITSSSSGNVNDGASAGTTVYTAIAADPGGGTVIYTLTGTDAAAFNINSSTGVVTIKSAPHYQTKSSYNFNVKASDSGGAFTTLSVTVTVNQGGGGSVSRPNLNGTIFSRSSGITFQFTNVAGASFTALASTNLTLSLSNWTVLGTVTENPAGHYQFSDPQATNNRLRFYSVRSP